MRLDVSGNLGIGTTNPEARLHIHSPDNNALKVTNTALGKTLRIGVDQLGSWLEPTEQNSSIRLNANPTRVGLLIDGQTGNVGIGTKQPARLLTLEGGPEVALQLRDKSVPNSAYWELQPTAFLRDHFGIVRYEGGAAQASKSLVITPDGNVGIGTTTPTPGSKLDVNGGDLGAAVSATSVISTAVFARSSNGEGVRGESVNSYGVYASSTNGNCIKAYSPQATEVPQVWIEADNVEPGGFARLQMQTSNAALWDIAVGGPGNVMSFDSHATAGRTVLRLFSNGDASLTGNLSQNSSRALQGPDS